MGGENDLGKLQFSIVGNLEALTQAKAQWEALVALTSKPLQFQVSQSGGVGGASPSRGGSGSRLPSSSTSAFTAPSWGSASQLQRESFMKHSANLGPQALRNYAEFMAPAWGTTTEALLGAAYPGQYGPQETWQPSGGWNAAMNARQISFARQRSELLAHQQWTKDQIFGEHRIRMAMSDSRLRGSRQAAADAVHDAYEEAFGGFTASDGLRKQVLSESIPTDYELSVEQSERMIAASAAIPKPSRMGKWGKRAFGNSRFGWHEYFMASIASRLVGGVAGVGYSAIESGREFSQADRWGGIAGAQMGLRAQQEYAKGISGIPIVGSAAAVTANFLGSMAGHSSGAFMAWATGDHSDFGPGWRPQSISSGSTSRAIAHAQALTNSQNVIAKAVASSWESAAKAQSLYAGIGGSATAIGNARAASIDASAYKRLSTANLALIQADNQPGTDRQVRLNNQKAYELQRSQIMTVARAQLEVNDRATFGNVQTQSLALAHAGGILRMATQGNSVGIRLQKLADALETATEVFHRFGGPGNKLAMDMAKTNLTLAQFAQAMAEKTAALSASEMQTSAYIASGWSHRRFGAHARNAIAFQERNQIAAIRRSFAGKDMTPVMQRAEAAQIAAAQSDANARIGNLRYQEALLTNARTAAANIAGDEFQGGEVSQENIAVERFNQTTKDLEAKYGNRFGLHGTGLVRYRTARDKYQHQLNQIHYRYGERHIRTGEAINMAALGGEYGLNRPQREQAQLAIRLAAALSSAQLGFNTHQYGAAHEHKLEKLAHLQFKEGMRQIWDQTRFAPMGAVSGSSYASGVDQYNHPHHVAHRDKKQVAEDVKKMGENIASICRLLGRADTVALFN